MSRLYVEVGNELLQFESRTSLELYHLLSSDGDLFLSAGVDALTFGTFVYRESTKTEESYFITFFQSSSDSIKSCFNSGLSLSLRRPNFITETSQFVL